MNATCACGETDCPLGGSGGQQADGEVPPAYVVDIAGHVIDVVTLTPERREVSFHGPKRLTVPGVGTFVETAAGWAPEGDRIVLGPDAARKVGATLDSLDIYAVALDPFDPGSAITIRESVAELRALLGLPRKT